MFLKMTSTLLILANMWVATEEGLIDGFVSCTSQVASIFEWVLLAAFIAAFVTALCDKECKEESNKKSQESSKEKTENVTEEENTLPQLSRIEEEDNTEKNENLQDMIGNQIRRRSSSSQ